MIFLNDDYTILDKVVGSSFGSLWTSENPLWRWYRPWSRELHFWTLSRLFGVRELPFHVAGFLLWCGVLTAYFAFVRRGAGARTAAVATAGAATLAAWGSVLSWAAGAQELWMLLFALLFLNAVAARRTVASLLALAGALLSKETAAVLPAIALVYTILLDRDPIRAALKRAAPSFAMVALWAALHPFLRARFAGGDAPAGGPIDGWLPVTIAVRSALTMVNLDRWPEPEVGWGRALVMGLPGAVLLALGLARALRSPKPSGAGASAAAAPATREPAPPSDDGARATSFAIFAFNWAVLGALPLFMPSVGWLSYYVLLSALGGWASLAVVLARPAWIAVGAVVAVALLQPVRATTPSIDWASSYYLRRTAFIVGRLKDELLRRHPSLPAHSRLYFYNVPNATGIGESWFNPTFRVWYRDTTVAGYLMGSFQRREAGEPADRDFFFRYDDGAFAWVEVVRGPEDVERERRSNAEWEADHRFLALQLGRAGDWRGASVELEKLKAAYPEDAEYPRNLSYCLGQLGDTAGMRRNLGIADSLAAARAGKR
jgi:hypothetical protein